MERERFGMPYDPSRSEPDEEFVRQAAEHGHAVIGGKDLRKVQDRLLSYDRMQLETAMITFAQTIHGFLGGNGLHEGVKLMLQSKNENQALCGKVIASILNGVKDIMDERGINHDWRTL